MRGEDIAERLIDFASQIIVLVKALPKIEGKTNFQFLITHFTVYSYTVSSVGKSQPTRGEGRYGVHPAPRILYSSHHSSIPTLLPAVPTFHFSLSIRFPTITELLEFSLTNYKK